MSTITIQRERSHQGSSVLTYQAGKPPGARLENLLPFAHGTYFLVTGIWPLINSRTFLWITGPKQDVWLVKTIGLLISVIGLVISWGGFQERPSTEIAALAIGSSAALGASDITYSLKRRISPVYLLDAVLEILLIFGWFSYLRIDRNKSG